MGRFRRHIALPDHGGARRAKRAVPAVGACLALGLAALLATPADAQYRYYYYYSPYSYWRGASSYSYWHSPSYYSSRRNTPRHHIPADEQAEKAGKAEKAEKAEKAPHGPLQLVVSIGSQTVTVYGDGKFVARAPVSTGMAGHPTPTGIFTVIQKQRWHESNLYSLAPMPFMQRITWSGVALHAGVLPGYPASHGCIRMPPAFATRLYGMTRVGARVIVARSDVTPVEIANTHLFMPKPNAAAPAPTPSAAPGPTDPLAPAKNGEAAPVIKIATAAPADVPTDATAAPPAAAPAPNGAAPAAAATAPLPKSGPITVLVSRKTGKLYVRQHYQVLFDAPVTIRDPERPLGTHVFTAMELTEDGTGMRWTAMTMPTDRIERAEAPPPRHGKHKRHEVTDVAPAVDPRLVQSASDALDRIDMPADAVERISELLVPGSSLIVSDQGISDETGSDTDFIVLTR